MRWLGAVAALLLCLSVVRGALPAGGVGVRPWGQGVACTRRAEGGRGGCPSLRLRGGMVGGVGNLAAYMLLKLGGTEDPTAEDVIRVLSSVDADIEEELIKEMCEKLKGRDLDELVEDGRRKQAETEKELQRVVAIATGNVDPGGGGGGSGGAEAQAEDKGGGKGKGGGEEKKQEDKKEESSLGGMGGSDDDMGFGLFD